MEHDKHDRITIVDEGVPRDEMRSLSRRNSSVSIGSGRGRVVAPENLLPITYRTL
jgi:sodium/potassium-transporting ATPase subunit alpha